MEGKVVLITGGSSGIGKAIGDFLTEKGFMVYGTTRKLTENHNKHSFKLLELDVRDKASIDKAIEIILKATGRIDILINNAGIGVTGPLEETPIAAVENVYDINFLGPLRMAQAVLPNMRKRKSGLIINITSIAGYMGLPFRGIYSSSKGALELLTETLRMEVRRFGVHIVNLAPGDFATNIAAGRYTVTAEESSPYHVSYKMSLDLMNEHVDEGGNPIIVAKKLWQIINTKKPKGHYTVGNLTQRLSIFLKKILPSKVFEGLLLRHYKL